MNDAQRALILAALGLTPHDGVMPRWSSGNRWITLGDNHKEWPEMLKSGWATFFRSSYRTGTRWRVTRLGAEAAGVLGRCRVEDVRR